MPFDRTVVIPAGWSAAHAPAAAGGMNATCRVFNPDAYTRGWDDTTEAVTLDRGHAVYDGPCRIQQRNEADSTQQAAQLDVTAHTYLIQVPYPGPHIGQGWHLIVTTAVNDTNLVAWTRDRPMVVADVQHGSERFTRDIVCTLNQD